MEDIIMNFNWDEKDNDEIIELLFKKEDFDNRKLLSYYNLTIF